MARAYRGPYARPAVYPIPYATASVWGTGINDIHYYYGEGPPLRVLGRQDTQGSSPVATDHPRSREYQAPMDASELDPPQESLWGYPEGEDYGPDSFGQGADSPISDDDVTFTIEQYMDDRPQWNVPTEQDVLRRSTPPSYPTWGHGNTGSDLFRSLREGSHRYRRFTKQLLAHQGDAYQPVSAEPSNSEPTETVSEGWINKTTSFVADAAPSADEQIFVQTSMRQRYLTKDNNRAIMRGTDDARTPIESRVEAMIDKVYSEGERLYDMFPYQIDQIERPFRWRTAGLGPDEWMVANEYNALTPVFRTPPADPAQGIPEVPSSASDYGYTGEDTMYYG